MIAMTLEPLWRSTGGVSVKVKLPQCWIFAWQLCDPLVNPTVLVTPPIAYKNIGKWQENTQTSTATPSTRNKQPIVYKIVQWWKKPPCYSYRGGDTGWVSGFIPPFIRWGAESPLFRLRLPSCLDHMVKAHAVVMGAKHIKYKCCTCLMS